MYSMARPAPRKRFAYLSQNKTPELIGRITHNNEKKNDILGIPQEGDHFFLLSLCRWQNLNIDERNNRPHIQFLCVVHLFHPRDIFTPILLAYHVSADAKSKNNCVPDTLSTRYFVVYFNAPKHY